MTTETNALDRIEEAARTAIANMEQCGHECNDWSRAMDRLHEIAALASAPPVGGERLTSGTSDADYVIPLNAEDYPVLAKVWEGDEDDDIWGAPPAAQDALAEGWRQFVGGADFFTGREAFEAGVRWAARAPHSPTPTDEVEA